MGDHSTLDFFISFLNYAFMVVLLLVCVAFVTLMEQKLLGPVQIRVGPNKVGFFGVFQPFADAVKLFFNEYVCPRMGSFFVFLAAPVLSLAGVMILWLVFPFHFGGICFEFGLLFFMCVSGFGVFPILCSGWVSNSKYSLLGSLRAVAQMISYEVSLMLVLLSFVWLSGSFVFSKIMHNNYNLTGPVIFFPLCCVWFASSLAETNRSPYDFSEGESELVSGFNTEYSSFGFVLIFMAEYASIIFMGLLFAMLFLSNTPGFFLFFSSIFIVFCFVWVRGTMPRFRYDKLMFLAWKSFLPISLFSLCYYLMVFN